MRRVHIGLVANAITAVRAVLTVALAALVVRSFSHDVSVALVVAVARSPWPPMPSTAVSPGAPGP